MKDEECQIAMEITNDCSYWPLNGDFLSWKRMAETCHIPAGKFDRFRSSANDHEAVGGGWVGYSRQMEKPCVLTFEGVKPLGVPHWVPPEFACGYYSVIIIIIIIIINT